MTNRTLCCTVLLALAMTGPSGLCSAAEEAGTDTNLGLDESLLKDALHAVGLGVQWLDQHQHDNGCWSSPSFPAMTALAVSAIQHSPQVLARREAPRSVSRGLAFIVGCVREDGGIYQPVEGVKGGGMPNYNTALCAMALADAGNPEYEPILRGARRFLVRGQHRGHDVFRGGMGYDQATNRPYADLSNTLFALEALRRTEGVDLEAPAEARLDWEAAIAFVSRCQHRRASNDAAWVSDEADERGGFVYHPQKSHAGAAESADGDADYLRSYGSMTYAGLLSFLYARVDRDDPRVRAAVDWLTRRWTVDENPGMGRQGLYYHYHTMAKALNAYGRETLELPGGGKVGWRRALVEKLVSLQRIDPDTGLGYWQNDNNRWWENDPNLATSYALMALEMALRQHPRLHDE